MRVGKRVEGREVRRRLGKEKKERKEKEALKFSRSARTHGPAPSPFPQISHVPQYTASMVPANRGEMK